MRRASKMLKVIMLNLDTRARIFTQPSDRHWPSAVTLVRLVTIMAIQVPGTPEDMELTSRISQAWGFLRRERNPESGGVFFSCDVVLGGLGGAEGKYTITRMNRRKGGLASE